MNNFADALAKYLSQALLIRWEACQTSYASTGFAYRLHAACSSVPTLEGGTVWCGELKADLSSRP